MEEKKINQMSLTNCDLDEVEIVLGDNFEMFFISGKWYALRKKSQYPKTYTECCEVLNLHPLESPTASGYNDILIETFQQLLVCRDAYWKIAGDWREKQKEKTIHYVIHSTLLGEVVKDIMPNCIANYLLDFPTEKMRDAFYENFKDLIEVCKELL